MWEAIEKMLENLIKLLTIMYLIVEILRDTDNRE